MKDIEKYALDNCLEKLNEAITCQDKLIKCYFDRDTFYESDIKDTKRKIVDAIQLIEMIRSNK